MKALTAGLWSICHEKVPSIILITVDKKLTGEEEAI